MGFFFEFCFFFLLRIVFVVWSFFLYNFRCSNQFILLDFFSLYFILDFYFSRFLVRSKWNVVLFDDKIFYLTVLNLFTTQNTRINTQIIQLKIHFLFFEFKINAHVKCYNVILMAFMRHRRWLERLHKCMDQTVWKIKQKKNLDVVIFVWFFFCLSFHRKCVQYYSLYRYIQLTHFKNVIWMIRKQSTNIRTSEGNIEV